MTEVEPVLMARKRPPLPVSKVSAAASQAAPRDARTGNEERYALAMQSINYGVYDADVEGGEVYFSASLRAMLGMKPGDPALPTGNIIGKNTADSRPTVRRLSSISSRKHRNSSVISAISPRTKAGAGRASTAWR